MSGFARRFCECSLKNGFCVSSFEKREESFEKYVLAIVKKCDSWNSFQESFWKDCLSSRGKLDITSQFYKYQTEIKKLDVFKEHITK